ncbi:MAG: endo alpha-1,4 polygalactosaminidase, partial [Nitrococcus sp.]|nr:endo alpha-1,4 polygalactosaminidase [Nitrococcus sp.]
MSCLATAASQPTVALYYGNDPPWDELRAFDVVVVDPGHPGLDPVPHQHADSAVFAYVSVGEVLASRSYFKDIPKDWLIGDNPAWASHVIDQAAPGWPAFFVNKVIAPLWAKGYRGFFLDTLDSWTLVAKAPEQKARQKAGLVSVIRAIKARWPKARLIFNRGFEILPQVHELVWMMAAESLYQGYNPVQDSYVKVSEDDRNWLLGQLRKVQQDYALPVLVIDYVPLDKRRLARKTARKIIGLGFIPWVTTGDLDALGVGQIEVVPRKVLVLYDPANGESLNEANPQRLLGIILAYLGLVPEYYPLTTEPPVPAVDRYAGVISWIPGDALEGTRWPSWLAKQAHMGLPLAFFVSFGVDANNPLLTSLGVKDRMLPTGTLSSVQSKDAL